MSDSYDIIVVGVGGWSCGYNCRHMEFIVKDKTTSDHKCHLQSAD